MAPYDPATAIHAAATRFDLAVPAEAPDQIAAFFRLLLQWNERINLTGATTLEDLVEEHLPDSLALARLVPRAATLVDVGTGGGLPALPFLILRPDVRVTLVEPRAKRVAFLRTALRAALPATASVVPARLESIDTRFDVAASRATFPPPEWLAHARQVLHPSGLAILFVATPADLPPGATVVESVAYQARTKPRLAAALRPT